MSKKGPAFERQVCVRLSLWWSDGGNDSLFWRTAGSGGRATSRAKKGRKTRNHDGDVMATDPDGMGLLAKFAIEIKKGYSKFTIHDLLDHPESSAKQKYQGWVEQAEASREASGSFSWLIVHKRDRREALVILPHAAWLSLNRYAHRERSLPLCELTWLDGGARRDVVVLRFGGFLEDFRRSDVEGME